jgi:hypothetical protein
VSLLTADAWILDTRRMTLLDENAVIKLTG